MKFTEILECLAIALGYASYENFEKSTGFKVTKAKGYNESGLWLDNFEDKLYASYSSTTYIYIQPNTTTNPFTDKDVLSSLKAKVAGKLRQQRVLESIKQKGIIKIKEFIAASFNGEERLVDTSDIQFEIYKRFVVGGITFGYSGTITGEVFDIIQNEYCNYDRMYAVTTAMNAFFKSKKLQHDS